MKDRARVNRWVISAYLTPSLVLYLFVFIVPVFMAVYLSLFSFMSIKNIKFLGLKNYEILVKDPNVWLALRNNLFLVGVCLVGQIGLAFILASMLSSRRSRFSNFNRTVIYFPVTLSAVIIGYVWGLIFDYNFGMITYFLKSVGMKQYVQPLLAQKSTVMWCVAIPIIWQYVGFHLIVIMAGMSSIDKSIYEMAEIDGANGVNKARFITLPLIRGTLAVCVLLCISANMRIFDHIMSMTNGGPGYSSNVLALYAYNVSFSQLNMGYGNALSVGILLVTMFLFAVARGLMSLGKERD